MKETVLYERVRKELLAAAAFVRKNHGSARTAGRADIYSTVPVDRMHIQHGRFMAIELKVSEREVIPASLLTQIQKADLRELAEKGGVPIVMMALNDGRLFAQRAFADRTFTACEMRYLKEKDAVISIIRSLI